MNLKLQGKNALVLGSSAGIGKAIAAGLRREGANVCISSRNEDKLSGAFADLLKISSSGRLIQVVCDVASVEEIKNAVELCRQEFGAVDILINNQGGPIPGGFEAIKEEQLIEAINTNLLSIFRCTKLCIEDMKSRNWGRIINILSISAKEPIPNMLLSNMIRSAVLALTKTVAQEYAAQGITVNSVLPSAVLTERSRFFIQEKANRLSVSFEDALRETAATLPSKYIASPEEFAEAVIFLCGEGSSYVNGVALPIDGASSKSLY